MKDPPYVWRVGDEFTDGTYRWMVDSIRGERAVLRSCGSSWATTIPLTFSEWREGGRWRLCSGEPSTVVAGSPSSGEPTIDPAR
jgi:hypothetical protein